MTIIVTQADIDGATPGSPCDCPVARAAKRATGDDDMMFYEEGDGWILDIGGDLYEAPREAGRFAVAFDAGEGVGPESFEFPDEPVVHEEEDEDKP